MAARERSTSGRSAGRSTLAGTADETTRRMRSTLGCLSCWSSPGSALSWVSHMSENPEQAEALEWSVDASGLIAVRGLIAGCRVKVPADIAELSALRSAMSGRERQSDAT